MFFLTTSEISTRDSIKLYFVLLYIAYVFCANFEKFGKKKIK